MVLVLRTKAKYSIKLLPTAKYWILKNCLKRNFSLPVYLPDHIQKARG